jgi:hypothetical protein
MFPHHLVTDAARASHDREREEARRRRPIARYAGTAGVALPVGRDGLARRVGLALVRLGQALAGDGAAPAPTSAPASPRR